MSKPFEIAWSEVLSSLHSLSPQPTEAQLRRIEVKFDPERQRIDWIIVDLVRRSSVTTRLKFADVWSNALPGELALPDPFGQGVLILDVSSRGWESSIVAVSDDDEARTLFGAASVCEVA